MAFSEIFQKVREGVDIVEVIGEHVALKRAGREFKGLCPFHDDHRPSMAVVPHKQIFNCFVCGMAGDVFKFVREYHKLSNGEALRMLAQRAGIPLPELPPRGGRGGGGNVGGAGGGTGSEREQIAATNAWACGYFEKTLRAPAGKGGLDYLLSRGLTEETIARFRLGFAADSWTALTTAAMKQSGQWSVGSGQHGGAKAAAPHLKGELSVEHLSAAGLIKKRASDGSPYDLFRNRVMFPIIDATGGGGGAASGGRILGFGGRVLVEKRDEAGNVVEAKYLNTPETPLFNKSQSIYGIHLARQHIIRTRTAVVVEGYMDVIACHQAGVNNVVATLGTALTSEHARMLKNYAQTIVLIFDSDDAGRRAADRAMEVFVRTPLDIKIAAVPEGKDPCDFCMKNGGEAFQRIVDGAVDAFTAKWNSMKAAFQKTDSVTARQDAANEFLRYAAASVESKGGFDSVDPIRRGQLIVKLSALLGLPIDEVTGTLHRFSRLVMSPTAPHAQPSGPPLAENTQRFTIDALRDAERWMIGFVIHQPQLYQLIRNDVSLELFTRENVKAELFLEYFENTVADDRSLAGFCNFVEDEQAVNPVIRAVVLWEQHASRWEDLGEFSDYIAKLVRSCRADRGVDSEKVVRDCLQYLIDAAEERMKFLVSQTVDDPTSLEKHFEDIAEIKARMLAGKTLNNVGITGVHRNSAADFQLTRNAIHAAVNWA